MIETIKNFLQQNDILTATLGISSAGIIGFWIRDVPRKLWATVIRQFTVSLSTSSVHIAFYDLLNYITTASKSKRFRSLVLKNGRWGRESASLTLGYGKHIIWLRARPVVVELSFNETTNGELDKEMLTLRTIGRNRTLLEKIVRDGTAICEDSVFTRIYEFSNDWGLCRRVRARSFDQVFLPKKDKDLLLTAIDNFKSSEKWHLDNGIPWQLGILLYGPPGTGKTTIVRAIADHLKSPIYYMSASRMHRLRDSMASLPDGAIIVVEDIDSSGLTRTRAKSPSKEGPRDMLEEMNQISLAEVLNSIDGFFSSHGRIFIATTNDPASLDPALTRPGRIDIKLEVGYVTNEVLIEFVNKFYPGHDLNGLWVNYGVTVAQLQGSVLIGDSWDTFRDKYIHKKGDF